MASAKSSPDFVKQCLAAKQNLGKICKLGFVPWWLLVSSLARLWAGGYVGEAGPLEGPVELLAQLLPDGVVLSYAELGPQERHSREQLLLTHELQQLEDDVVLSQEASPLVRGHAWVSLHDASKHADHFVFDFAWYVGRLLPSNGEGDVERVLDVFGQLQLTQDAFDLCHVRLARVLHLSLYLLQRFRCDVFAFSALELSQDLFEVIFSLVESLWLRHVVVEVRHD